MIHFHRAVVARLRANAGVAALVAERVYALFSRQGDTRAMVVYRQLSSASSRTLNPPRNRDVEIELTAWATDYEMAHEIQQAVEAALDGFFNGTWPVETPSGSGTVAVRRCFVGSVSDAVDEDGMIGVSTTFSISYQVN